MIRSPSSRLHRRSICPAGSLQPTITLGLNVHQPHPTTTHLHTVPSAKDSLRTSSAGLTLLVTARAVPINARCAPRSKPKML